VKGYLRENPGVASEIERKIYDALEVEPATAPLAAVGEAEDAPEKAEDEPPAAGAAPEGRKVAGAAAEDRKAGAAADGREAA
jgi:hypothetical protein